MESIIEEIYKNQDKQVKEYVLDLAFFRQTSNEIIFIINMHREYEKFSQASKKFYFIELKRIHSSFFQNYLNNNNRFGQ
jgi:hypothetical protein